MIVTVQLFDLLRAEFGDAAQENVLLAPYTSARIGGVADVLLTVKSGDELERAMQLIWNQQIPYYMLGGGANVLISDKGIRGVTILNKAKEVRFEEGQDPKVWCESGVIFSNLANRCAAKGLTSLEWGAAVPGTIGGAVYGNAGAFGGDMSMNLIWTDMLTENGRVRYSVEQMDYVYRNSILKRGELKAIVLSAMLSLKNSTRDEVSVKIEQFSEKRRSTQPPGASMGSMFKNPPGDYAGRLIEAAGLKGRSVGNVEISMVHGNFFVNYGDTKAGDVYALIRIARDAVKKKFGVELELEVELAGEW